jgi:hypothetical protein
MPKQPTTRVVQATYQGLRLLNGGGIGHVWAFPDGNKIYKKNLAPASIGEVWDFHVSLEAPFVVYQGADLKPKQTPARASATDVDAWEAQAAAHEQHHREEKADKALARRATKFERYCEPLATMHAGLRTLDDREAFIRAVTRAIRRQK